MEPATFFTERYSVAKKWLEDCENEHGECIEHALVFQKGHESFLPTRYLDLWTLAEFGCVRLVQHHDGGPTWRRYATLSHRWPTGPISWVTTEENLEARMNGLSVSSLPRTIQDCIRVVIRLGIGCIWFDSLCIVQDSETDWARQSSEMTDIYGFATVTIFADGAADDNVGMIRPRAHADEFKLTSNDGGSFERLVNRSLLSSRAWIFQERFMSRRILHITSEQMLWECRGHRIAESAPFRPLNDTPWLGDLVKTLGAVKQSQSVLMSCWPKLVEEYTQRKLTFGKDKLPALSGLASYVANRTKDSGAWDYIAGMWGRNLKTDLLWESSWDDPKYPPRRPLKWRAPT